MDILDKLKPFLIEPDKLKVGDVLFDSEKGNVTVTNINGTDDSYTLICETSDNTYSYTVKGYYLEDDPYPRLFKSNPFAAISEYPKVMLVSDDKIKWEQRVVFTRLAEKYIAWSSKKTIEDLNGHEAPTRWAYAKELPQEEPVKEITLEEVAALLGKSVEKIRIKK